MSRSDIIFTREQTAFLYVYGMVWYTWHAPSILNLVTASALPNLGSMWISEAPRLYASIIILLTSLTIAPSSSETAPISRSSNSSGSSALSSCPKISSILPESPVSGDDCTPKKRSIILIISSFKAMQNSKFFPGKSRFTASCPGR